MDALLTSLRENPLAVSAIGILLIALIVLLNSIRYSDKKSKTAYAYGPGVTIDKVLSEKQAVAKALDANGIKYARARLVDTYHSGRPGADNAIQYTIHYWV